MSAILLNLKKLAPLRFNLNVPKNTYAKKDTGSVSMIGGALKKKKIAGKMGPAIEKKVLPVETDTQKLVSHVCGSNIYKTGEDIKLLPDSEYPDWLWTMRVGKQVPLEELEPNSKEYYLRVRLMGMRRNNQLAKLRRF